MTQRTLISLLTVLLALTSTYAAAPKGKAQRPDAAELARQGAEAVREYRFDDLADIADRLPASHSALADSLSAMAATGSAMLERVEKIVVIDSLTVDADRFFQAYRLSDAAGRLTAPTTSTAGNSPVYITESGTMQLYAARPAPGSPTQIAQARILADGKAEQPRLYPNSEGIASAAYPFLMTDGLTLYFAATGEQSLGGYDIFITRRNSVDDEFLQPQNLGMPFNSPYNDYMMAIDEATGLGWWATDRHQQPGKLTIYVFRPEEMRTNLTPDTDQLLQLAALSSISLTQPAGFVKPDIAATVAAANAGITSAEFQLAMPDGRVLTRRDQLKDRRARMLIDDYVEALADVESDSRRLDDLRAQYAAGRKGVAKQIEQLEQRMDGAPARLLKLTNEIVRAESGSN